MGRYLGVASRKSVIPAHIRRRLLKMPDIDGCWVAISPPKRFRRSGIIAMDRQRGEVERLAIWKGFYPGDYSLFRVAHKDLPPDKAFETHEHTNWARWIGGS